MKSVITFVGLLIITLCFVSCDGNNRVNQNSDLERREAELKQREDSLRNVELKQAEMQREQERKEQEKKESESFTTSLGTFNIENALNHCYQMGVGSANLWGDPNKHVYDPDYRELDKFKEFWTRDFGIPNNEKAKDVFNRGFERYKQGWDDNRNF